MILCLEVHVFGGESDFQKLRGLASWGERDNFKNFGGTWHKGELAIQEGEVTLREAMIVVI